MKDLNHEPDFDPALEHELRKLAPAPVKERLLESMENAVTHNTASVKPAQHPTRNWRLTKVLNGGPGLSPDITIIITSPISRP